MSTLRDRFDGKSKRGPDCWLWTGATNGVGYGMIQRGRVGEGMVLAHRLAWEFEHGPIPEGMCVLHRCDTPPCVRPSHLFLGTHQDNHRDMCEKARQPRGEGHRSAKLTNDEVRQIRSRLGQLQGIAVAFGVSVSTVWDIRHRRTWAHLD